MSTINPKIQQTADSQAEKQTTRLCVVTETWAPEINGVAHTIGHLVSGLLDTGQYHVQLVRPRQSKEDQPKLNNDFQEVLVKGVTLPFYKEVKLGYPQYNALKRLWTRERPDIVQVVTEGPLGYSAIKAARKLGIPVFSDFHTNFDQYSRFYGMSLLFPLAKRYLRDLHNKTLKTLVPTNELIQQLSEQGYENLGLLDRGIRTDLFNPERRSNELRQKLGVEADQLLVVLVSRMAQEKNLDLAFEAFRAIEIEVPDAKFLLVGDGPERQKLQEKHHDCIFVGKKVGEDLAEHYASGDLFIYPSISETFGNVVIEAMASGVPTVAFDYAAPREFINSNENGVTVPFDDEQAFIEACAKLAKDQVSRRRMTTEAPRSVAHLGWDKVVQRLDDTIQSLLGEC